MELAHLLSCMFAIQVGCVALGGGFSATAKTTTTSTTPAPSVNCSIWNVSNTTIVGKINGMFANATACYGNQEYAGDRKGNTVSFRDLHPGCDYNISIWSSTQIVCSDMEATNAASVTDVKVDPVNSTALNVNWTSAPGCVKEYNVSVNGSKWTSVDNTTKVSDLQPGCIYVAEIITQGYGNDSPPVIGKGATAAAPVSNFTLTAINTKSLVARWEPPAGCVENYLLSFNGSIQTTKEISMEIHDLLPGHNYTVNITVNGLGKASSTESRVTNTYPSDVKDAICQYASSGYSIVLSWLPPDGIWTRVEVQVAGRSAQNVSSTETSLMIDGLQPARTYTITLKSYSGDLSSAAVTINCMTDPRGVIAGVVVTILILILVAVLAVVVLCLKPDLLRQKFLKESEVTKGECKLVPVRKFADHFHKLSRDQNRGFSEEYENFSTVGIEQTSKAALIPENKAKNRFSNVLPYDSSRVKLTVRNHDMYSDYINASYIPGYGNNRKQYIAAQGPLQSTVNDFWRMIWEQGVRGIVMVTNCNEAGRVKCEQYWPRNFSPETYGDLLVNAASEFKHDNWTLREFSVKNMRTLEVRCIKHFHFTAWPDHGVPSGTSALIEFRRIVRQHIENCCSDAPTVVHCSAGVGRTGTLIALDVTLQQLQNERAVGLAAFVHKMRLHRPLMVQTESQYIFLHQCIMDILGKDTTTDENIYENTNTLYVNATALRDFVSQSRNT